ncbi:hypothetical protein N6H05_26720 (plasmid) [Sphingobium sp. WTD-1]|jgi:hypothetical protein|uniref:Uncharacterized protein n=1 Tax=Sphingomonas paucimobilis TaxID=13689 RepID=A0A7Y2KMY2_SPHPI|nr:MULTISPECIES: hypothetical protein [Sphingomonadaceae]NNG56914.1 hypothetical protein [Sphingomonas paucimobilis]WIA58898.1 hypothetical protein N6H05_26720 [Sphingobium sp. WTD-1]
MFQPDFFAAEGNAERAAPQAAPALDLPGLLDRLTSVCERPRYSFMVLNLIAQASAQSGSAGPYVREGDRLVPVRDWLCDALVPVARRDPRRLAIADKVRAELEQRNELPSDTAAAQRLIATEVQNRIRLSGRTNVSRAVSELVRAGFVQRHYQGYRVDHHNRGAQRQAVYTITDEVRRALHPQS